MKDAIASMRREVARMQRSEAGHEAVSRAACELDAVFDATERATTTILGAAEDIESAATMLRADETKAGRRDYGDVILERVVLLYETCNFQDVTGQRIRKVVATLKFIEERLDAMLTGLGGAFPAEAPPSAPAFVAADPTRLHGPALPGDDQNSQSEIDRYFG